FQRKGGVDIISGLEGLSAALVMSSNLQDPTGSPEFFIRGVSTLQGSSRPLIILDGFEFNGKIENINPYEVESIVLLKDAASASIYGAKSSNGVIVITTKRGKEGKVHIQYTNNYTLSDKLDLGYVLKRPSSSELVDIQYDIAKDSEHWLHSYRNLYETNPDGTYGIRVGALNKVAYLFAQKKYGYISQDEFDRQINLFRGYDNTQDIRNLYLQNPSTNQHNFTVRGGSKTFNYRSTINYTTNQRDIKRNSNDRILLDFVTKTVFSPKIDLDFQVNTTYNEAKSSQINEREGLLSTGSRVFDISSYDRFLDEKGNPLSVAIPFSFGVRDIEFGGKDPYEIERLKKLGLLDESYYPVTEFGKYTRNQKSWSTRIQGTINAKLFEGFTLTFGGTLNKSAYKNTFLYDADSWYMKQIINNTTPLNYWGDPNYLNIPLGARYSESRGETLHYLLRSQFGYQKTIAQHNINAIFGMEAQETKTEETNVERLGYDPRSGLFPILDNKTIADGFSGVFNPNGDSMGISLRNNFLEVQNRHLSAYGNLIYTLNNKYVFSGSLRLDQSNLFGTDPKYRYRPFWSAAFRWRAAEENFLKDKKIKLDLRATYGINGNIANDYGPFDIATRGYVHRAGGISQYLTDYKVNNLRWERTTTTNLGFDLGLFNDRLEVNFDYYRKNSTDILSKMESDPTFGSRYVPINGAEMYNNGFEVRLVTKNIKTLDFLWETQLNFSYNHSKITKIAFDKDRSPYRNAGSTLNIEGESLRSLYVLEYAGLDNEGNAQIRQKNGSLLKVDGTYTAPRVIVFDDLKWAGNTIPTHTMSMNNNLSYKGLSLSFLLLYQGGHVTLKDTYNGSYLSNIVIATHSDVAKAWKKPGDEAITDIPKINSALYSNIVRGTDKNVIPADFMRLRDVTLSYNVPIRHLEKTPIKSLILNLKGGNLWLWTKNNEGIDPERHSLGVRFARVPKSYTLGATLTF
ncbi:MAG: SusC/RagA family TonB-linked outer membrane protein, partial [Capnocytophaga felis]|nr:SusC/RagA family TonB-linked outer membrane protein [Capnocytophaga felis]